MCPPTPIPVRKQPVGKGANRRSTVPMGDGGPRPSTVGMHAQWRAWRACTLVAAERPGARGAKGLEGRRGRPGGVPIQASSKDAHTSPVALKTGETEKLTQTTPQVLSMDNTPWLPRSSCLLRRLHTNFRARCPLVAHAQRNRPCRAPANGNASPTRAYDYQSPPPSAPTRADAPRGGRGLLKTQAAPPSGHPAQPQAPACCAQRTCAPPRRSG